MTTNITPLWSLPTERATCRSNPFIFLNGRHVLDTLAAAEEFISSYRFAEKRAYSLSTTAQGAIPFQKFLNGRSDINRDVLNQSDLEVVPDDVQNYGINQIRSSDALYFTNLYNSIAQDKTCLKIVGSQEYKTKVLKDIQILLTRPSGRRLIGTLCSLGRELLIEGRDGNYFVCRNGVLQVSFCYKRMISQCADAKGKNHFKPDPSYILLAHEFIHVLHNAAQASHPNCLPSINDLLKQSPNPFIFRNFSEQLTIAGLSEPSNILCENVLRAEFNLMARISHYESDYLCYKPADLSSIDQPNQRGVTRLSNAVCFQDYHQLRKLLAAGANPGNGFVQAIFYGAGREKMVEFFLKEGANPNLPNHKGDLPLHFAISLDKRDTVTLLIDWGCDIDLPNNNGQRPLEYALENKMFECALLLLSRGAQLTQNAIALFPQEPPELSVSFSMYCFFLLENPVNHKPAAAAAPASSAASQSNLSGQAESSAKRSAFLTVGKSRPFKEEILQTTPSTFPEEQNTNAAKNVTKKRSLPDESAKENCEPAPKRVALIDLKTGLPRAADRTYCQQEEPGNLDA